MQRCHQYVGFFGKHDIGYGRFDRNRSFGTCWWNFAYFGEQTCELDTYKRPLHCTDLKRETLYIRENDEWSRENDSKEALKGFVNKVANKNCKNIEQWRDEHPEYQIFDSPQNV